MITIWKYLITGFKRIILKFKMFIWKVITQLNWTEWPTLAAHRKRKDTAKKDTKYKINLSLKLVTNECQNEIVIKRNTDFTWFKVILLFLIRVFLDCKVATFRARVQTKALMFNASTVFRKIPDRNAWNCIDNRLFQIDPFHFSKAKLSFFFFTAYQTDKHVIKTILLILFSV